MEYTFKSRYGDIRKVIKESKNTYIVEGKTNFTRASANDDGSICMFDFEGGPFVMVGEKAIEFNVDRIVTSIQILDSEEGSAKIKVICK